MSFLKVDNISFRYAPEEPWVLQNLSLELEEGKCLIVEGANGSGKSTLFRILNGLSFPQKGSYYFAGQEITAAYLKNTVCAKTLHKRIGYLFQNPDVMLFNNNVYDELAFGPRQMGLQEKQVAEIVEDCLELFEITALKTKAPYHLSGGQKKRVALAAIMTLNSELLVLDEPLASLDKRSQDWLIDFLLDLRRAGKTMIIATHDEKLKQKLGDKWLLLEDE